MVLDHQVEVCSIHPNAVVVISADNLCAPPTTTVHTTTSIPSEPPWKGTIVVVTKTHHRWYVKKGHVTDVICISDSVTGRPVLQVLVQLKHYNPNTPFHSLWFSYFDIVKETSYLPLNEARLLQMKGRQPPSRHPFFHNEQNLGMLLLYQIPLNDTYLQHGIPPLQTHHHTGALTLASSVPDLDWTVAVVVLRAPYLPDDVTDEKLILHNSKMTIVEETKESKALNFNLKKQL
ncbi:uncharacterized protein EV420DRAFT_1652630 [Desarmillaria tabescens]|uniref:Uncharacterized protein n=1 Tax=Armillaria tabescens TaxID=1929756 RepID=A0AA39J664_ARMTA|nr:uncharacterized protein EV420DRAFT_1652630 [Desarmillaria tabescens]KAK0436185.1 hypothetical protein EV420DRAFT_1652630 [Desarmillaria tabescens]